MKIGFRIFKMSFIVLIAHLSSNVQASEISFLNNPSRVEINGGTSQTITSDEALILKFDQSRLAICTSNNRMSQSFLTASYSFDGGQVENLQLNQDQPTITANISVPQGAQLLTIWFHNYTLQFPQGPPVCEAYDSNDGQNFNFKIQPK